MVEFFYITHVFQYHYILCIQRDIATLPLLVEEFWVIRKSDIPVMAAFREYVTYVL